MSIQESQVRLQAIEAPMLIAWRPVSGSSATRVVNPAAYEEEVGSVPEGSPADAEAALVAASEAFAAWSARSIEERGHALRQIAEAVLEDAEDRARLLVRESGKVLAEAQGEIRAGCGVLSYYADLAEDFEVIEELPSGNGKVFVARESMGVVAVIVPWNAPILLAMLSIAPALLAGNTVVVKPSTEAPLALMDFVRVMDRHLPPGVINVVTGQGAAVGQALVTHPLTNRVMFTGSTEVGRSIASAATQTLKRVSLELGGNDPAVVLADADLDGDLIPELIAAVYPTSGQVCYAVKRIYVQEPIFHDFVDRFVTASDHLVVGDGLDGRSDLGPLINARQLAFVERLVEEARHQGATVAELGRQLDPSAWTRGFFHRPTVLTDVDQSASVVQCEQFGPVVPIMPYSTLEQGIDLANDTDFGLAASIWTSDEERGFSVARRIEAGTTFVNTHRPGSSGVDMPFGGMKQSGLGRGHGVVALEEQFELHTLSSRRPQPRVTGEA